DVPLDDERGMVLIVKEIDAGAHDIGLIFTLLALIYPTAPIRAAYRNLRGGNAHAKGFALEYLHSILPTDIRLELNPVVERMGRPRGRKSRPVDPDRWKKSEAGSDFISR